jgi:type VI secretion system protein ImpM
VEVGLFGKLPNRGDFLRRRASDAFVDAWDAWLRDGLTASREALGERWLDLYLTSPLWRFVLAAGTCGPSPVIGLMAPSVDRVGRPFPLVVVASLPADVNPIAAAMRSSPFFERAERLMIDTLAIDEIDFDRFDEQVSALAEPLEAAMLPPRIVLGSTAAAALDDASASWQIQIGSTQDLPLVFEQLLAQRLASLYGPWSLWWSDGSSAVEPSCLIVPGLPAPDTFVALLDGAWSRHRWRAVAVTVDTGATVDMRIDDAGSNVGIRSAAATDIGLTRAINEDAFIERPEAGMWAVADGLGGHRDGEVASHMVCDALAELVPDPTFDGMIESARQRLQRVNEYLLHSAAHPTLADRSASTVVLLLVRGSSCAVLWAGDSRVYRWRAGRLERLTRDHSVEESEIAAQRELSNAITRAVGVQETLILDVRHDRVCAGDRYLLCSDGLTRTVPDVEIESCMKADDVGAVVRGLISATLTAGAPDNVTVVVAEAFTYGASPAGPSS